MGLKEIKKFATPKNIVLGVAALLLTGIAYLWLTPDNFLKDNFFDKRRAKNALSRLDTLDDLPLGDRTPWVWVHDFGLQPSDEFGPSIGTIRARFGNWSKHLPQAYMRKFSTDEDLYSRVKVYYLRYDSSRDPRAVGDDLDALIEGNSELTRGNVDITFAGISHGGRIVHFYQLASGGRKVERVVTSGTAHRGMAVADAQQAEDACMEAYPYSGFLIFSLVDSVIDYNSAGMQSMVPRNADMDMVHTKSPLDERWYLYGGTIEPDTAGMMDKAWVALNVADALLLEQNDATAADIACPVGARIIEASGETLGSDGVVPLRSAHAQGWAKGATTRTFDGYNHRNMLQGLDDDQTLYDVLIGDLVTFEPR